MAIGKVERVPPNGRTVTMQHGFSGTKYEELEFRARVYDANGRYVNTISNSSLLCLSGGSIRATDATDLQILNAVLNDESVFD